MAFPLNATLQPSHLAWFFPGSSSTTVWVCFFFCKLFWFALHGPFNLPVDLLHAPLFQSSSPAPYLPPQYQTTPVQPHRPSKKDLGNWTELYFRDMNLTTPCRAGWRQQASWEPSTKWENLNMERTGDGKWIKMKWKTRALGFVLGCQGNYLISLKSWCEGLKRKKLSKVLLKNFWWKKLQWDAKSGLK